MIKKEYWNGNDISRLIRTVIIALKLYPKPVCYYSTLSISIEVDRLKTKIEETPDVYSQETLHLFEELLAVNGQVGGNKNDAKRNMDNMSIKNLVYDSGYYAKIIGDSLSIIDYCGNDKNIVIPEKIAGLPVTAIDDYAFLKKNLIKITFNSNIKSIGESAFYKNNLTNIEFTEGIKLIGKDAFRSNKLAALNLPMSVIHIGESAFLQNKITSLSLPNGSTFTGEGAFRENKINSLSLPEGISIIKNMVYYDNELTSVVIPKSVTNIEYMAFDENPIKKISIPGNVKIEDYSGDGFGRFLFDDHYNKNKKRGGIYTYNGVWWEGENEPKIKKWLLINLSVINLSLKIWLNNRRLARYEENLSKHGITLAMSKLRLKIVRLIIALKRKMTKKIDPIPKEVWGRMEEDLKKHIKEVIKNGYADVTYSPKIPDDVFNSGGFSSLDRHEKIIVSSGGALCSSTEIYDVESGICIMDITS